MLEYLLIMLLVVLSTIFLVTLTVWLIDKKMKQNSSFTAASQIPGSYMYPIIGNLLDVLSLNSVQAFSMLRTNAAKHKSGYRFWILGVLHYNAIHAKDIEVCVDNES